MSNFAIDAGFENEPTSRSTSGSAHHLGSIPLFDERFAAPKMGRIPPPRPIDRSFAGLAPLTWRSVQVDQLGISHTTYIPIAKSRYNALSEYRGVSSRHFISGRLSCPSAACVGNRRARRVRDPPAIGCLCGTVDG